MNRQRIVKRDSENFERMFLTKPSVACIEAKYATSEISETDIKPEPPKRIGKVAMRQPVSSKWIIHISTAHLRSMPSILPNLSGDS